MSVTHVQRLDSYAYMYSHTLAYTLLAIEEEKYTAESSRKLAINTFLQSRKYTNI